MGDNYNNSNLQKPEEEEVEEEAAAEEEALSLCDLPLNPDNNNEDNDNDNNNNNNDSLYYSNQSTRRSTSEPPEFFEFFSDFSSEMCPAEDIIFCGKLIPFKKLSPPTYQTPKPITAQENPKKQTVYRRRSDSLSKLQSPVTRSNSSNIQLKRNSRSLDYTKLQGYSNSMISPAPEIERNSSVKSVGKSDVALRKASKPRWYLLMFGMVKFPAAMELSDIKNRQVRRNTSSTLFPPPLDVGGKLPVSRNSGKGSWSLLKALSCKDYASVSVTTSFYMPHV